MSEKKTFPQPSRPSSEFLDGFAAGVQRGLDLAEDDCIDGGACLVPSPAEQRPLGATDDDLAGQERLSDDRLDGDGDDGR